MAIHVILCTAYSGICARTVIEKKRVAHAQKPLGMVQKIYYSLQWQKVKRKV